MSLQEKLEELEEFDTPSISNVVATYPDNPLCLGLYDPWQVDWYTDETIECQYPGLEPRAGYTVTCVFGFPDSDFDRLGFGNVVEALDDAPAQSILAIEQDFPEGVAGSVGLTGGNTTAAVQALDCVGCVSDGPGRDIEEIRPMDFQYLLTGTTPAHGEMSVHAVNVPVSLRGMDVAPGEIIHMDETGAIKFPADRIDDVLTNVKELVAEEDNLQQQLTSASSADEVRAALEGEEYGDDSA